MVKVSSVYILCVASAFELAMSCDIPSVEEGMTAFLNCHFGDTMQDHLEIFVYHQRRNASAPGDIILNCFWSDTDRNYNCPVNLHSITPEKLKTGNWTLPIPNAVKEKEGNYSCYKGGSDTDQVLGCNFSLTEESEPKETTKSQQPTTEAEGTSNKGADKTKLIVGLTVGALLLAIAVGIMALLYRRRKPGVTLSDEYCPRRCMTYLRQEKPDRR